jgi:hypothetical protein
VLKHQRTLEIAGTVQARGKPEMAFEQGARLPEHGQNLSFSHQMVSIAVGKPASRVSLPRRSDMVAKAGV